MYSFAAGGGGGAKFGPTGHPSMPRNGTPASTIRNDPHFMLSSQDVGAFGPPPSLGFDVHVDELPWVHVDVSSLLESKDDG